MAKRKASKPWVVRALGRPVDEALSYRGVLPEPGDVIHAKGRNGTKIVVLVHRLDVHPDGRQILGVEIETPE